MKNSTFSAQVANNLLTLLQGYSKTIRLLLVMLLTLTVTTNVWGADFEKYSGAITEGDYLIVYNNGAMNNTVSSSRLQYTEVTVSNNKISNPDASLIWHIAPNGSYWTIYNANVSKYAAGTGAKNKAQLLVSGTDDKSLWTVSGTSTYEFVNKANKAAGVNSNLRRNDTYGFACYATGTGGALTLYKKVTAAPSFTVTATSNNNNYGTVSVSGTTITASPKTGYTYANPAYTVTAGSATVSQNGNTFTVTPTSNCTVCINFAAKPKYTVTLNAGSGSVTNTTLTEASAGAGVTLPTPSLDCDEWTFAGWAAASVGAETTTKPTLTPAGAYSPTSNITLYAVYQRTEETEGNGGETEVTNELSFANTNQRTSYSTTQQVWEQNGITLTNDKSSSTSNVGDYSNPARFYKSSKITITAPGNITQIQFKCVSGYVISIDGASTSSTTVTVTLNGTSDTYIVSSLSAQVRLNSLSVTYTTTSAGGTITTTYYHSTPDCGGTPEQPTYSITIDNDIQNGTIVADKSSAAEGETVKLTVTPEAGYKLEAITVTKTTGGTVEVDTKKFTMPASDVTVSATFTEIPKYTVSFSTGTGNSTPADISETVGGAGITLPDGPTPDCSEEGWEFGGWSTTNIKDQTTTISELLSVGSNYKPTKNTTLYAVYSKTESAGNGGAQTTATLTNEEIAAKYVNEETTKYGEHTIESKSGTWGGMIVIGNLENTKYIQISSDKTNRHLASPTFSANITNITIKGRHNASKTRNIYICSSNETAQPSSGDLGYGSIASSGVENQYTDWTDVSITVSGSHTKFYVYADGGLQIHSIIVTIGGSTTTTYYHSNPCEVATTPTWEPARIDHNTIQVACGSKTQLGAAAPNGPATITFSGYDLQNSVTVTASEGFLVSTNKEKADTYQPEVIVNPHKDGQNIGTIQNVYVIAQAPAQSGNYDGTITLAGNDIPDGGEQVINVTAAVTCTQYTITWSVNGDETQTTTFYAGGEWTLPEDPTFDCNGRVFVGWTNNKIVQPQDIAPNVLYKEQGEFPTIESDITFYAVFAQEGTGDGSGTATVTDVLNREWTEVSGTTYKDWNGKTARSSAVYAGNSAGGNESIQLRSDASKDAAGIITTTSGGKATNITVVWYDETAAGRTLNVYGKKSAYSAVADLRSEDTRGTLLGTIVKGTSTSLTINNDYEYIGLCSNSGAMYLTSIAITWATDGEGDGNATTYTSYTTSCADVTAIRIVEPTTKTFNEGDKLVFDGEVWAINSDGTETNVTNSSYVSFTCDMNKVGTQTVTVSYLGFTATYEITINAVDKWQITWNVSGATNTGLGPKEVAKGTAIGKLPQPKEIPAGCTGKEFRGWTESNTVNSDGSNIEWITEETVPKANTTYYAVFATPSGSSGDGDYVKVTETPADFSGEYLIVYEEGAIAFNGGLATLDAASNTISVTITDNTIEATNATNAAKFTITKSADGYTIKSASGYFIGQTTNANGLKSSTTTYYSNNISINNDESAQVISGGTYLRYNNVSAINQGNQTGLRFRYFKSDTYTNQQPIALYKKSGSSASYTDYTTGCHDVTITYYGFTGGYTTNCGGSDLDVIKQRVNSAHTIPNCGNITDPTNLGRTFLNLWKDQNGKVHQPGETFIVTQDTTLYAQWALNTSENTTLPTDVEDLATTDIVVTGGTTLTLQAGTTTINSLTLKGGLQENGTYAMPVVNIPNGATLVRNNNKINLDLKVNNKSYYPFAVPFEVANTSDNVNYINPTLKAYANAINGYGTYYRILEYNGALRAENGVNSAENWVQVGRTGVKLMPGKGYAISAVPASGQDTVTIRITMTVDNAWLANGEQESITVKEQTTTRNKVTVTAYTGDAATEHLRHAGWNFVANPYLAKFAGSNVANDVTYIKGSINIQDKYTYEDTEVTYVTVPAHDFSYYEQFKLSTTKLSPAYSFFVQVGTDGTMTFETTGRQQAPASIAARNAEERPVKMDVDITLSDNHSSDQTGIIISDRYSDAYEIGRDLEKLFGSAYNLSVYTLMADNTPLAFQALAIRSNMQVIPVGYRAPEQGEYTFRLNEATSSIDLLNEQYEQLVLVDYQTGELTNLLIADYTFYSERTQADNRFAIYAVPRQNAPTDLPNAIGQDKQAQKIIHNGHLYILRDGNVYNGNGQIVK